MAERFQSTPERMAAVPHCRGSPLFMPAEKAALEFAPAAMGWNAGKHAD